MASEEVRKPLVTGRMVCPAVPEREKDRIQLAEDLEVIGCAGLFRRPWIVKNDRMIQELVVGVSNQYQLTVRGRPVTWTDELWSKVYEFRPRGAGLASRTDKFATGKFKNAAHAKEGYAISDCIDGRQKQVLEFLIPILYPEKPTRVTVTVANTIFGAMEGRPVYWGKVIGAVVAKLAANMSKAKTSPIGPYIFHLYHFSELLSAAEIVEYNTGMEILRYGLTEEVEMEEAGGMDEDPEPEAPMSEPKRRKNTNPDSRGKLPELDEIPDVRNKTSETFFKEGLTWVMQARSFHQNFEELMQMLADELKVDQMEIFNTVKKLPKPEVLERKDRQIKELLKERTDLQARVDWAQGELEIAKTKEKDALQLVRNLSALVDQPAESVVKAALIQK
jgi:rRNA processing protein Krr1/Pno1